jgi:hypothetical protein
MIDPLQKFVITKGKGIVDGFIDGEISIAPGTINIRNGMTYRAGNPGLCHRVRAQVIVRIIKSGIIKCTAEKGHLIMAAGTKPRAFNMTVACHHLFPGVLYAKFIDGIVE